MPRLKFSIRSLLFLVTLVAIATALYLYLGPPRARPLHLIEKGMSKSQVLQTIGKPDFIERSSDGSELWSYRSESGFSGWITPYFIFFGSNGITDGPAWS